MEMEGDGSNGKENDRPLRQKKVARHRTRSNNPMLANMDASFSIRGMKQTSADTLGYLHEKDAGTDKLKEAPQAWTEQVERRLVKCDPEHAADSDSKSQLELIVGHHVRISEKLPSMQVVEHSTPATRAFDRYTKNPGEAMYLDFLKFQILKDAQEAAQQRAKLEDELVDMQFEAERNRLRVPSLEKNIQTQSELIRSLQHELAHCKEHSAIIKQQAVEEEIANGKRILKLREELEAKGEELNLKGYELQDCRVSLKDSRAEVQNLKSSLESLEKLASKRVGLKARIEHLEILLKQKAEDEEEAQKRVKGLELKFGVLKAVKDSTKQDLAQSRDELKHCRDELKRNRDEFNDWKLHSFCNPTNFTTTTESSLKDLGPGNRGFLESMTDAVIKKEVVCEYPLIDLVG